MTTRHEKSIFLATLAAMGTAMVTPHLLVHVAPQPIHAIYAGLALSVIAGVLVARQTWKKGQPQQWSLEGRCRGCGYDLFGLTGDQCPECGRSLTEEELRHAASAPRSAARPDSLERLQVFAFVMGLVGVCGAFIVPASIVSLVPQTWHEPVVASLLVCFSGFFAALAMQFVVPRSNGTPAEK